MGRKTIVHEFSFRLYCCRKTHLMARVWRGNMMSKTAQSRLRPRIRSRRIVLCLGILIGTLIMSSVEAIGQLSTGTITGTVTDQTGEAVPGVTVALKKTDKGISRTAETWEKGDEMT